MAFWKKRISLSETLSIIQIKYISFMIIFMEINIDNFYTEQISGIETHNLF